MDIILKERGHGKTIDLIYLSAQNNNPIVCMYPEYVSQQARELGLQIPKPIYARDLVKLPEKPSKIYMDEMSIVLNRILGCSVAGFTDTL